MPHLTQKTVALKPFHPHEYPDSLWSSLSSKPVTWRIPGSCFSLCGPLHSLPMTHKVLTEPPLALYSSPLAHSVATPLHTSTVSYWRPPPCLLSPAGPGSTDQLQPVSAVHCAEIHLLQWGPNQSLYLPFFVPLSFSVSVCVYICVCMIYIVVYIYI